MLQGAFVDVLACEDEDTARLPKKQTVSFNATSGVYRRSEVWSLLHSFIRPRPHFVRPPSSIPTRHLPPSTNHPLARR
jgi:hypothetical protein